MDKTDYTVIGCSLQFSIEVKGALYEMIVIISILFPQNVSLKAGRQIFSVFSLRNPSLLLFLWGCDRRGRFDAAEGGLDGKAKSSACVEDALLHLLYLNGLDNWHETKI